MKEYLPIIQIIVAIFLILTILLQQRGGGLGSAFGGSADFFVTRRGIERKIFLATCVFGAAFIVLALLNLIL